MEQEFKKKVLGIIDEREQKKPLINIPNFYCFSILNRHIQKLNDRISVLENKQK